MKPHVRALVAGSPFAHPRRAEDARKEIHGGEVLRGLSETFKVLGDETRLKICLVLAKHELCVGDIAGLVGLTESAVSHQLRMLRHLGLVTGRRAGRTVVYGLFDNHVAMLLDEAVYHTEHLRLGLRDAPATGTATG